jgi:hypothetical protein
MATRHPTLPTPPIYRLITAAVLTLFGAAALSSCAEKARPKPIAAAQQVPQRPLDQPFEPVVPVAPYLERLAQAGQTPAAAFVPDGLTELNRLVPKSSYRYVVRTDGQIVFAPIPDGADNPWTHIALANGQPVMAAGFARVLVKKKPPENAPEARRRFVLDQDSRAYCPTFLSLTHAKAALAKIGVPEKQVRVRNTPPDCGTTNMERLPKPVAPQAPAAPNQKP